MGKLADWCETQPEWARDALHRAASVDEIGQAEVDAVVARLGAAHGIPIGSPCPCEKFSEEALKGREVGRDDIILCSLGPLEGIDRLAEDQELKFALTGITLIFGDNASGKSGYVRALRQLCHARVAGTLKNDVFAELGQSKPIRVSYVYKQEHQEPSKKTWALYDPRPNELSGITVLDTENARVYVEGENEILFLPPEVNCLTRLGKLYSQVGARFQANIDALNIAHGGAFGGLYDPNTPAGSIVHCLTLQTSQSSLPSIAQLREAGRWTNVLEEELERIEAELAQSPHIAAAGCLRASKVLGGVGARFESILAEVDDDAVAHSQKEVAEKQLKREIADIAAAEQIGGQPIGASGSDTWRRLFQLAREFAAEADLRGKDEHFQVGDPCPLCQQSLNDAAAERLAAFDAFVEGKANAEAEAASKILDDRIARLRRLSISSDAELGQLLSEFAARGGEAHALSASVIQFGAVLRDRRDRLLGCLIREEGVKFDPLDPTPIEALAKTAGELLAESKALLESGKVDPQLSERAKELRDQKRLHEQLDEMLSRRDALELRLKQQACVTAVNTLPVSRLATAIRKDLVTPELSRRIREELAGLNLGHIPLKFDEKTERGTSFFEVALATDKRADKEGVLSEGEQRALSVACFLAESHVAGRKSAIIFDDPVTSLDHKRMRKVAQRLVREATGRQIVIFTHNMLFYQEVLRACAELDPQVPALPCVVRQYSEDQFGIITNDDKPWVAKKVKERERALEEKLKAIPDDLAPDSNELRQAATSFYAELRETWERAVEEVLLNAVVERFGTDVRTQSLKGVEVTDDDYRIVFNGMKRASEYSGHDRAAGRQLDPPAKDQMRKDLDELIGFRTTRQKRRNDLQEERKKLEDAPTAATI